MELYRKCPYSTVDFSRRAGWYIIWKLDGSFYWCMHPHQELPDDVSGLEAEAQVIPKRFYLRRAPRMFKVAPTPLPDDTYVKRFEPKITDDSVGSSPFRGTYGADLMVREVRYCELLQRFPHPNICEYRGILVDEDGKLSGICFERCGKTLGQAVEDGDPIVVEDIVDGVRKGIVHLHGVGIAHCDIKPDNICLNSESQAVIIDFDSCHWIGDQIKMKGGTPPWSDPDGEATEDMDLKGLLKIEEWLNEEMEAREIKHDDPRRAEAGTVDEIPSVNTKHKEMKNSEDVSSPKRKIVDFNHNITTKDHSLCKKQKVRRPNIFLDSFNDSDVGSAFRHEPVTRWTESSYYESEYL
ncbi:serine threonine kinase [Moniliophthora roreri MCA 2997]|uniref:Serine threonine kinase n=1 Tax=Moniliophthora roreri (strain MCA 2997) TaxID=1381753 RepID=V2Y7L4_MONRO|nr:serine threonine kinase [Moniliophthora roreri MCA 2997]